MVTKTTEKKENIAENTAEMKQSVDEMLKNTESDTNRQQRCTITFLAI